MLTEIRVLMFLNILSSLKPDIKPDGKEIAIDLIMSTEYCVITNYGLP